MGEPNFGGIGGPVRAAGFVRGDPGFEDFLSERFETHEHDVLVIGAGGAGLRAAIEALAPRASVGVASKTLLGKAHTVMAEGRIAPAIPTLHPPDPPKPPFPHTPLG